MGNVPVSYTHLDVYKRQGLGKALLHHGQRKHLVEHVDAALEVLELLEQRDHVELGDIPVSYTHLDVYKRQTMHWASTIAGFMHTAPPKTNRQTEMPKDQVVMANM